MYGSYVIVGHFNSGACYAQRSVKYKKNLAKIKKRKSQAWIERSHVTGRYVTKGKTLYSGSHALDTPMKTDSLINTNTTTNYERTMLTCLL